MIVVQFLLTLLTIYVPAIVGVLVFGGLSVGGLFFIDEWDSTR